MKVPMSRDHSHGWEAIAVDFQQQRSAIGAATVRRWCTRLPTGARVLDLGCGCGEPVSAVLLEAGCAVWALDASPSMVAAYAQRFPQVPVRCEAAQHSDLYAMPFDGVVAIGLLFLLPAPTQRVVLRRVAQALAPGGRLLFTAPARICRWRDALTGHWSRSLGLEGYRSVLQTSGLSVLGTEVDEGGNHYIEAGWTRTS